MKGLVEALQGIVRKMVRLLRHDHPAMQGLFRHLQMVREDQQNNPSNEVEITKQLVDTIEYQVNELTYGFTLMPKCP